MSKKKVKYVGRKNNPHYIDNKKFYEVLCVYLSEVKKVEEKNKKIEIENKKRCDSKKLKLLPKPVMDDYIGLCIIKLANKLANRGNFSKYPFREEMIGDAIENCLRYLEKFDPEKSNNPFAYYTTIIWRAFLRRIEKEHIYLYTKYAHVKEILLHDIHEDDKININKYCSDYSDELMNEFMTKFETTQNKKKKNVRKRKKRQKNSGLDFLDDE